MRVKSDYLIYIEELVTEFYYRELPFEIEANEHGHFNGHTIDICALDDSTLVVVLPPVTNERVQVKQETLSDIAQITIFDKYSMDGEYIGSFVIQDNCAGVTYDKDRMFVANPLTASIGIYEFE